MLPMYVWASKYVVKSSFVGFFGYIKKKNNDKYLYEPHSVFAFTSLKSTETAQEYIKA